MKYSTLFSVNFEETGAPVQKQEFSKCPDQVYLFWMNTDYFPIFGLFSAFTQQQIKRNDDSELLGRLSQSERLYLEDVKDLNGIVKLTNAAPWSKKRWLSLLAISA